MRLQAISRVWCATLMLGAVLMVHTSAGVARTLNVEFEIVDVAGKPVPYVTVWSAREGWTTDGPAYSVEDVWNATLRYHGSYEYTHAFFKPVDRLRIPPMSNEKGHAQDHVDPEGYAATGSHTAVVPYTFMHRGSAGMTMPQR